MTMEEFAKGLTPEQAKKFAGCKSADEVATFAKAEGLALPEGLLDGIAGGTDYNITEFDHLQEVDRNLGRNIRLGDC